MHQQTLHPGKLVVEFWPRLRIAVRRIERGDNDTVNRRLDIARLPVVRIAGQFAPCHDRLAAARQDGDAVPGLLAAPHGAVTRLLNRGLGEFAVGGFKLLQRDDVGLFGAQPADQITEPLVHVVDVESRYLHRPTITERFPPRAACGVVCSPRWVTSVLAMPSESVNS